MQDFFVSYNRHDREWAEWIAWQLEQAGYTTTLQAWDFRPGSNFVLEMNKAAAQAERTIAVLSPDYLASSFTQPEWAAAFAQDPTGANRKLLPVRVRECGLTGLLPQIVYIDLVGLDEAAARQALLAGVKPERAKPTKPPAFPAPVEQAVTGQPRFPGALPPIWNVPHLRNPNFTGREELLGDLRQALASGQPAALTQVIAGLGGVGKTQLAAEYAYRRAGDYALVWWVRAEESATLVADLAALAKPLDLPEAGAPDLRDSIEAVQRWLNTHDRWLLILDNARDAASVRDYFPQAQCGHALVTSRDPNWLGVARVLPVKTLPRDKSVEFLLKRTEQTDADAADELAEELGDLPLALEQAGAYIEQRQKTLAEYLALYRQHHQAVLEKAKPSTDYPDTVATTWLISFQQIEQDAPQAANLLNLLAFFAPDDIPIETFQTSKIWKNLAGLAQDAQELDDAIAALRRYSFVERQGGMLAVHRLVQAVTRDRLSDDARRAWAEAAAQLVAEAFPSRVSDNVEAWPVCARLLPHALAASEHAESLVAAPEATGQLLNQAAIYLWGRAAYAQAQAAFERALRMAEAAFGPEHPEVATAVNNLGNVLQDLGDLPGARACYERALRIDEAAYGPEHPNVATDVNNLGSVLQDLGDLPGARAAFERALRILRRFLGEEHPKTVIVRNNLAALEQQMKT